MDTKKDYRNFYNYDEELTPSEERAISSIVNKIMLGIAITIAIFIIAIIAVFILILTL